jgi:hypothetical protein
MAELSRDAVRAQIFGGEKAKVQKRIISFFGADIELRQPTLGAILAAQKNEDREAAVIDTLIENAFIPGTEIHVFEDTDADQFKAMPFGDDFISVSEAIEEMTSVNFRDKQKAPAGNTPAPNGDEAGVGVEAD